VTNCSQHITAPHSTNDSISVEKLFKEYTRARRLYSEVWLKIVKKFQLFGPHTPPMHRWDEIWRDIYAKFHPRNRMPPPPHRTNYAVVLAAHNAAGNNGRGVHTHAARCCAVLVKHKKRFYQRRTFVAVPRSTQPSTLSGVVK